MESSAGKQRGPGIIICSLILLAALRIQAATFLVSSSAELDTALNTARGNGQNDVITLISGIYYTDAGFMYYGTNENYSLTIQCTEGGAILDGQKGTRVLAIKTSGGNAHIVLSGLTIQNGWITNPDMGAGLMVWVHTANVTLTNMTIINNRASALYAQVDAAGMFLKNDNTSSFLFQNNIFSNNYCKGIGGGIHINAGYGSTINFIQNTFITNSANIQGGGVYVSMVNSTLNLDNNIFTQNLTGSGSGGGGLYAKALDAATVMSLRNSIIWGNQAENGIGRDMYIEDNGAAVRISNCCYSNLSYQTGSGLVLSSNTAANPLLTADLHLRAGSPCIDAGTNLAWMTTGVDYAGQPRIFNGRVDMGPHEAFLRGLRITITNGIASQWDTVDGAVCQLQYVSSLASTNWQNLGAAVTSATRRVTITDTNAVASRFYRLKWTW